MGLTNLYEADDDFRLFCGQLDAFLPIDDITEGMNHLRNSAPDAAASHLDYFDASYVTGQPHAHGVPADGLRLNFHLIAPFFPPRQWNMHDVTLANQPQTNNVSEGWNNKFQSLVGHTHPKVWKLVECIQAECARVCGILLQDEIGILPKKRIKNVYVELQIRLHRLYGDRASGRKSISEFLRGVRHNLRGGQPNI